MKKTMQKVLPASLAALMMFSLIPPALAAEDATEKEEIIYANLSSTGQVQAIYVVNAFDLEQPQTIHDYGAYTETKNLSTSDALIYQDGQVSISAPKGRFYYQGTLPERQLPWEIQVSYFLDGSPIDASTLAGSSGHLEIKMDITKNSAETASFYENYALQATLALDTSRCKNISADGATEANVGTDKQLTYTILPGSEKHISIQSDVTDFEMDGININGISLALDVDADQIDTPSFTGKINDLKGAVSSLHTGAQDLANGSGQIRDGLNRINDSSVSLTQASSTVLSAIGELSNGAETLKTKLSALPSGLDTAVNGLNQVTEQSDMEKAVLANLKNSQDPNVQALLTIYQSKMGAVGQVANGLSEKKTELADLKPALTTLTDSLSTLEEQYDDFDAALGTYTGGVATIQKNMGQLAVGADALSDGANTMNQETSHIDQTIDEELQKAIDSFAGKDFTPVSFVSPENEHVDAVQFVLKTADIHKPEPAVPEEEKAPQLSFLQKLANLFYRCGTIKKRRSLLCRKFWLWTTTGPSPSLFLMPWKMKGFLLSWRMMAKQRWH